MCDSFIKAHGSFAVSKAHRQIFHQWTVPDLSAYTDATLQRFRKALGVVDRVVLKDLRDARCRRLSREQPPQSSINLHKMELPTPSLTTILSDTGTGPGSVSTISRGPPENAGVNDSAKADGAAGETQVIPAQATIRSEATLPSSEMSGMSTVYVSRRSPEYVSLGWVGLHICLDDPSFSEGNDIHASAVTTAYSSRAAVSFESFKNDSDARQGAECEWLNVEDIPSGEGITIEAPGSISEEGNMEFVLRAKTGNFVRVRCTWHKAEESEVIGSIS